MKILITGGGTREPIDGVRFIANFSTGKTAAALADHFAGRGDSITYVCAQGAPRPIESCTIRSFVTFADLDQALQGVLREEYYDAVIHLAAVSDYSIEWIEANGARLSPGIDGKLPSGAELMLKLKPNFKIVDRIKTYATRRKPLLIAFKLTHSAPQEERLAAVEKLFQSGEVDYVVHNDLGDRNEGVVQFRVFDRNGGLGGSDSISALARSLAEAIHDSRTRCR